MGSSRRMSQHFMSPVVLSATLGAAGALGSTPAPPPRAQAADATTIFASIARSVFLVEAYDEGDQLRATGSAVVVETDVLVTNLHVVTGSARISVRHGDRSWRAVVRRSNARTDLAELVANNLDAPPVDIRLVSTVQVGKRVFALGAPRGLEATFSEGIVSALRGADGQSLIQTTAPISPGSSGGGLFDAQGRLLGITASQVTESQNLNFAIPSDQVVALRTQEMPRSDAPPAIGSPTLEETLAWLQGKLKRDTLAHASSPLLYDIYGFGYNGCNVAWSHSSIMTLPPSLCPKGQSKRGQGCMRVGWDRAEFALGDVTSINAVEEEYGPQNGRRRSYGVALLTERRPSMLLRKAVRPDMEPPDTWTDTYGSEVKILLGSWEAAGANPYQDTGERVMNALRHAVALCGGAARTKREPF